MNRKLLWPFSYNFFHFAAVASVTPFLVLHYQDLGFNGDQIGLLTGITPLITLLFNPLWTGLADTTGRHHAVLGALLLATAAALVLFPLQNLFLYVLLVAVMFYIFFGSLTSFSDSAAMTMLGDRKALYGRVRMGGTFGYGIAAVITGMLVERFGIRTAFWCGAAMMVANFAVSRFMAFSQTKPAPASWRTFTALLKDRNWLVFILLSLTGGFSLGILSYYLFPTMDQLGAGESTMGFALAIGTMAEVPVMFFGDQLIRRLGSRGLIKLSILITAVRFMLYAAVNTPAAFLMIQLSNGLTFPAFWIAGVTYADKHAPPGLRTTTQGLFSALVWGFGNAAGGFLGGPLFAAHGGQILFLGSGAAFLIILGTASLLERLPTRVTEDAVH